MIKRLLAYVAGALFLLSASGCLVAESTYLKKVEEAEGCSKEMTELQQMHKKLVLDNAALKTRFNRLVRMLMFWLPTRNCWRGFLSPGRTRYQIVSARCANGWRI